MAFLCRCKRVANFAIEGRQDWVCARASADYYRERAHSTQSGNWMSAVEGKFLCLSLYLSAEKTAILGATNKLA